jgi:zinc protease
MMQVSRVALRAAWPLVVVAGLMLPAPGARALDKQAGAELNLSAPLPTDPALVTGTLPNGVRYIIREHANPKDRVSVWMHVSSGALNEETAELGLAHYLEHMAFNGSANFPPGQVVKFFESLGLTFGQHQNAFTSIDQTTYQLALADNKAQSLDQALLFFSDVAFRLTLDPGEIDQERSIILEEKRSRLSPGQRVSDQVLKRIAPGSRFETNMPLIGTEETIKSVQRPAFESYWKTWYTPGNITLIVVGDLPSAESRSLIEKHFGAEPARTSPPDRDVGVKPYTQDGAIVVTDPEQLRAEISFNKVFPASAPTLTQGQMRDELVELIGTWCLNQRLAKKLEAGAVSFINADVSVQNVAGSIRWVTGQITAEPAKWGQAFKDLATEVRRAQLHGFEEAEVQSAIAAIISGAEQQASREGTQPAQALLRQYNGQVAAGEPIMSPTQNLQVLQRLLPTLTAPEVSARFAKEFDPANLKFVAELPSSGSVPTEAELIAFGRSAMSVTPAKEVAEAKITALLDKQPAPGKATDASTHSSSGVTSAWLPSGARVHHRFIDVEKQRATVTITLAGGVINETPANRGVTDAAMLIGSRTATGSLRSTQIREFMTDKKVDVRAGASEDAVTITVTGNPSELATGLELAYLMLTDPVIEPAALDQWKTAQLQAIAQRQAVPQGVFQEMLADSVFPAGDARQRPLTAEQVQRLTAKDVQAWLKRLVAESPMEVAVVGDITIDKAMPLVETFVGSLPARERIGSGTLASQRRLERTGGPRTAERTVATQTKQAIVLSGFFGADATNLRDVRLLNLASRVLTMRMNKVIREEKQLVYSIGARSAPATAWPGYGLFFANAPTDTAKVPALISTIGEIYDAFAKEGPTADELGIATKQIFNTFEQQLQDPGYWTVQLGTLSYRDRKLDDIMSTKEAYGAFTSADVREAFARYYKPDSTMVFSVLPKAE